MFDSTWPHWGQPTRLHWPWDSPGKNTGVGCHFLLQCRKVKSESEVAQSCLTLSNPMDCSLPGSPIHGIFQARVLEWVAIAFSKVYYVRNILITKLMKSTPIKLYVSISDTEKPNGQLDNRDHIQKSTSFNHMEVLGDKKLKFHYLIISPHISPPTELRETFNLHNTSLNLHIHPELYQWIPQPFIIIQFTSLKYS